MKYCSECGTAITRRWVASECCERYLCSSCGTTHYQNPRVIVGAIICCSGRILMCRRSQEPAIGKWIPPTGFLEVGETLQQGAARETFEETGVIVDPAQLELLSITNMTAIEQIAVTFRASFDAPPVIRRGPECLDVAFLAEDEIPAEHLAWRRSLGDSPQRLFNEIRTGAFTIRLMSIGANDGSGFTAREYGIKSIQTSDGRAL
jgi:ADP-ribose pyrophosphatase YjhB (NUDIX family)